MEIYPSDLERYLRELRIAINVCKSSAMLFAKVGRRIPTPRPVKFFGDPIHCVDTSRNLGVAFDKQLTWSNNIDQVRKNGAETGRFGTSPKLEERSLHHKWSAAV